MVWSELELRWVLLGLGALVVLGVFLGGLVKPRSRARETPRPEPEVWPPGTEASAPANGPRVPPTGPLQPQEGFAAGTEGGDGAPAAIEADIHPVGGSPGPVEEDDLPAGDAAGESGDPEVAAGAADGEAGAERVVSLRLIPREGEELDAERTVQALREAGLQHGPYGIFHYCEDRNAPQSGFSVANLVEPGSFDLSNIAASALPGVTFFMVLPGSRDPVARFDRMVDIARELRRSLDAQLLDELGNSWSIQRERYLREELIEYRRRQT